MEKIKNEVSNLLSNDKSGHADDHTFRVYNLAMKLCDQEECDREIVALASLLHDCDDYKLFGQENADNLTNAKIIMKGANINIEKQEAVCDIIHNIGYSKLLKGIRPKTLEGRIVSDADMLDAIGALGIVRCLSYSLNKSQGSIFDRNIWPNINISQEDYKKTNKGGGFINHFFEKLLKLKNLILTEAGRNEVGDRHNIMVFFLKQFFIEQNLDDWNNYLENYLKDN